jgi:hypothetical protein
MATAFYPQGMHSYNNSLTAPFTAPYRTWKGTGLYSNPVGITAGNIRPLTNKDYTNIAVYKKGAARPIKRQFRKQTLTQVPYTIVNPNNPNQYITVPQNRATRSAAGLENKTGGLIGQLMDRPGGYSVKENKIDEVNESLKADLDCKNCTGISVVTNYYPQYFLTNNPLPVCTNPQNCCNEPRKALLRVRPASTNLKKNYFTTLQQYRENRCNTYEQKAFNFKTENDYLTDAALLKNNPNITAKMLANAKPGSPLTLLNTYVGNCYPNTGLSTYSQVELVAMSFQILNNNGVFSNDDVTNFYNLKIATLQEFVWFISSLKSGNSEQAAYLFKNFITNPYIGMSLSGPSNPNLCKLAVYKPSNPQFAVQGAVSSSARTLKLTVATIRTAVSDTRSGSNNAILNFGKPGNVPFIYKSKVEKCTPALPIIFRGLGVRSPVYTPATCGGASAKRVVSIKKNLQLGKVYVDNSPAIY